MKKVAYFPCRRCCDNICIGNKRAGTVLKSLVVAINILYWFAGCTVVSIAIWIRFVDVEAREFFSGFLPFDIAMYVILVTSILYLVISFVGTCAGSTKNEMLITLYVTIASVVLIAEIVSLIIFSSHQSQIEQDFSEWYKLHFRMYKTAGEVQEDIVDHIQSKMKCCGLNGPKEYKSLNESIPPSCIFQTQTELNIVRAEIYTHGCSEKLTDLLVWLLRGWPTSFTATMIILMQVIGIVTSSLLLQHIYYRRTYRYDNDDDDESSGLIDSQSQSARDNHQSALEETRKIPLGELPLPRMYRIMKSCHESFGLTVELDEARTCFVISNIEHESNAEYAGLTVGSTIIEMNGILLEAAQKDEVHGILKNSQNELRIVVVDENTDVIYKLNKVFVNLKNLEGVTSGDCEYKPRLCTLEKVLHGFGFHLLYLEDRKGEYIEEVAQGSPAYDAGLNVGDRIVEVNGVNIEREKSSDVVRRIRTSGNIVNLLVVDPKTDGYFRKKGVSITASLSTDYFNARLSHPIELPVSGVKKNRCELSPRYCRLNKSAKEDFGLYIVIDNNRIGQVVRWVDCGGPADRAGLRIGDRIIEVNGHSVEYEPHRRLISCISLSSTISHFIVVDEEYDRVYKRNKPRLCHIFKESETIGFSICFVKNKSGHYIKEVDDTGPADRAGLKVGDRIIQINGTNVEHDTTVDVLHRLRTCENDVTLLVIDSRSNKHYKQLVEFKSAEIDDMDYDYAPLPDVPLFLREDMEASTDEVSETVSLNFVEQTNELKSTACPEVSLRGKETIRDLHSCRRQCIVNINKGEKIGFSLVFNRERNGQIITRIVPKAPADRAGLLGGDRIINVNGEIIDNLPGDKVMEKILHCGSSFILTVIGEREDFSMKYMPYLFRIAKVEGGYGFYLWHDEYGHYVENVTIGSPADKSGMRSGDRIIEVNGVNVEEEKHEDLFYRVKASSNVVTLLAVDLKTFKLYKSNKIPVSVFKAESSFSGNHITTNENQQVKVSKSVVQRTLRLHRNSKEEFGFNLAYSNSFMGDVDNGTHVVHWVESGGVADIAGLRDGDKIVAIDGENVCQRDHDYVIEQLYQVGKCTVHVTIEYEEYQDGCTAHEVMIVKTGESLGFHLWFDRNGHYIEDVTINSLADAAGLKIGDRVLKVNGINVEEKSHAAIVSLIRGSKSELSLFVISIQSPGKLDFMTPSVVEIVKENGTFGFTVHRDDKGFHIDYVAEGLPAERSGIDIGARLIEVNGEPVSDMTLNHVVGMITASEKSVFLTMMSTPSRSHEQTSSRKANQSLLGPNVLKEANGIRHTVGQHEDRLDIKEQSLPEHMQYERKSKLASGEYNNAFMEDEEQPTHHEFYECDPEGRYLEEKISRAVTQATKLRRKPGKKTVGKATSISSRTTLGTETRRRNLSDIERKLSHSVKNKDNHVEKTKRTHSPRDMVTRYTKTKKKRFELVTTTASLRERWKFEQTNSRNPGEVESIIIEEPIPGARSNAKISEINHNKELEEPQNKELSTLNCDGDNDALSSNNTLAAGMNGEEYHSSDSNPDSSDHTEVEIEEAVTLHKEYEIKI